MIQTDVTTAELTAAGGVVLGVPQALDRDLLSVWVVRALTIVLIIVGLVMTIHILSVVGFAVYGLPRSSFRRREETAEAA